MGKRDNRRQTKKWSKNSCKQKSNSAKKLSTSLHNAFQPNIKEVVSNKNTQQIDEQKNIQLTRTWAQIAATKSQIEPLIESDESTNLNNVATTVYDPRILRWFDQQTTDQEVVDADAQTKLYHSFPLLADKYIFSLGIQTDWQNQTNPNQIDKNYSLGGEIICANGVSKQVVFTCCKDSQGVCYHRGYTVKEKNSLFDEYFAKSCWEVNFPPLGLSNNTITNAPVAYTYQDKDGFGSYIISENELCVRIKDNKNNVTIILYKPHKDN